MGGIKRFFLILFALAGALCLCALALPWIGPWQREFRALMSNWYYYTTVQVALGISVLGLLIILLRALFTPPKRKAVIIEQSGGDQITVSLPAISSQAVHVVESSGNYVVENIDVSAKKHGSVCVDVRVKPVQTVDVSLEGKRLHDELAAGLAVICGNKVKRVNLEFVEAQNPSPIPTQSIPVLNEATESIEIPSSVYERAAALKAATKRDSVSLYDELMSGSSNRQENDRTSAIESEGE